MKIGLLLVGVLTLLMGIGFLQTAWQRYNAMRDDMLRAKGWRDLSLGTVRQILPLFQSIMQPSVVVAVVFLMLAVAQFVVTVVLSVTY